ncbi:MAG: glycerate kinase [Pleurocapsa sp. MO_226.B13]|nr:glycerate kinase [Pleurocapsa sp. MO_226.B13]
MKEEGKGKKAEIFSQRLESLTNKTNSEFFADLSAEAIAVCNSLGFEQQDLIAPQLEKLWLPTALELAEARQKSNRTIIQGILGGQGTGKSTLCIILKLILNYLGFEVASLSIDDLYLTHAERQELKRQNPRLIWRGPPGTHDVALGLKVIEQCLQEDSEAEILMPRFDKSAWNGSGDRISPEAITKPDILLFEGWFVGVKPVPETCFDNPPAPIVTAEDIQFAKDNNQRLQAYLPLWEKLDRLIVLYPEDYRLSKQWRKEAEHKMIASGKTGMSDEEIDRFVEYFWQALHPELLIEPLTKTADLVVEIKSDRSLGRIHRAIAKK